MRIVVLLNDPGVPPGRLATEADRRGHTLVVVRMYDGEPIPDRSSFDAVVALGGEMGAYETEEFPFLEVEKEFLASVVGAGTPTLGLCLGGQLLADALGGEAFLADKPEVAFEPIEIVADDDAVATALSGRNVVLFHRDTWTAPAGAVAVARSSLFEQMFRFGSALAVQAHPEVTQSVFATWASEGKGPEVIEQAGVDRDALMARVAGSEQEMIDSASAFFGAWFAEAEAIVSGQNPDQGREGAGALSP